MSAPAQYTRKWHAHNDIYPLPKFTTTEHARCLTPMFSTLAASFTAIRILLTLVKFHCASLDIKGAYLQSGPCKRYVIVRPPNEWSAHAVLFGNS
jgi:hypothetical protein